MSRLLVVEDETHIASGLRFNLEAEGYAVDLCDNGEDALKRLLRDSQKYDALVLDVMLPGKNGFTVAQELRAAQNFIPVLMLTARGRPEDVLKGFESGADDYLPKPFNLDILLARLNGLLRRKTWAQDDSRSGVVGHPGAQDVVKFNGKIADFQKLQVQAADKVYQLTLMESELLRYLIRNAGRPVSRKEILEKVWDLHEDTDTRAIDNFIVRLRRYIEMDPAKPRHLLTIRGLGYQFVAEPERKK
ncbi:MAG TPA: response regulator transcription factor [Alphaproteobacteria bacterium]|nr:response regulator transcription factor [Alphaproteobacteria bacterium]